LCAAIHAATRHQLRQPSVARKICLAMLETSTDVAAPATLSSYVVDSGPGALTASTGTRRRPADGTAQNLYRS